MTFSSLAFLSPSSIETCLKIHHSTVNKLKYLSLKSKIDNDLLYHRPFYAQTCQFKISKILRITLKNPEISWDFQVKNPDIFPEISGSKRRVFFPYELINYLLTKPLNRLFHNNDNFWGLLSQKQYILEQKVIFQFSDFSNFLKITPKIMFFWGEMVDFLNWFQIIQILRFFQILRKSWGHSKNPEISGFFLSFGMSVRYL